MKAVDKSAKIHVLLIVSLVMLSRCLYLLSPVGGQVSPDEAVFGLMAQKIMAMDEFPIYMWENHYAGAVVSYIAAAIFHFFGSGPTQLRLAMLPFAVLSITLFYVIYRRSFDETSAFMGSLFLVFCPYVVLYYSMGAFGTYGETLLGISLLILAGRFIEQKRALPVSTDSATVFLGFLSGFFFYICFLIIPAVFAFAVPAVRGLNQRRFRTIALFLTGCAIGAFPFILYNLLTGGWSFLRAGSWALATGRDQIHLALPEFIRQIFINKSLYMKTWFSDAPVMFGMYVLPDLFGDLAVSLAGGALMATLVFFVYSAFSKKKSFSILQHRWAHFLLFLVIFQWITGLYRPRHLIPLVVIIPVIFLSLDGGVMKRRIFVHILLLVLSLFQAIAWTQRWNAPVFDPRPVAVAMKKNSIDTFYGTYHSVYPIMFASKSQLLGSPRFLRKGTSYFDPLPQCSTAVRNSKTAAFVFLEDEQELRETFRTFMKHHHITYRIIPVDGHSIYFCLSRPVDIVLEGNRSTRFILKEDLPGSPEEP